MTDAAQRLALRVLPTQLAVARLDAGAPIPDWVDGSGFLSLTRTRDELSVVCEERLVPRGVPSQDGWRCLQVIGPLDLGLVGVLASLIGPLAAAGLSTFALSTYDTDYLMLREEVLETALEVLRGAGHEQRE